MNLPSIAELEELYPGLSSLVNAKKSTKTKSNHPIEQLQRALRPWIIKQSLYNTESDLFVNVEASALQEKTNLEAGCFGLAHWKREFFAKFPQQEKQTIEYFILLNVSTEERDIWKARLQAKYNLDNVIIEDLIHYPVFQISSKTLNNDFQRLSQLQSPYLISMGSRKGYKRIDLSVRGEEKTNYNTLDLSNVLNIELYGIAEQLTSNIKGVQRFFIHTEYIVKGARQDNVGDAIASLKSIWNQDPVPLIELTYDSASLYKNSTRIVYPICVRYLKRALYLAAYGQDPKNRRQLSYRNYRLDRILNMETATWDAPEIPSDLKQQLSNHPAKYSPQYIIDSSLQALGSDFYRPIATMVLRFPKYYHEAYIEDTLRHQTFKQIDTKNQASLEKLFKQLKINSESAIALQQKIARFADDAYYQLNYRVGDNDVIMRLRAWGANVEVLHPPDLRDRMIKDISDTYAIYQ